MRQATAAPLLLLVLLLLAPGRAGAGQQAFAPGDPARWEADIRAFEEADRTSPPPRGGTLFIGSSSIRLWKTLASDFPDRPVINRGFGGSQLSDAVHFFDRIVLPYRPRQIVLYAGSNDIAAGEPPEQVAADFREFVARVRRALPGTPVAFIAIAPNEARWSLMSKFTTANELVRQFTMADATLSFIDVVPHMLGADGRPKPELYVDDRLHMNANGYELWTRIVRPYLR
ncbi:MAG TPA: SGNH/GDSL hydrolase family protein [Vicinamibacterales bacterium]